MTWYKDPYPFDGTYYAVPTTTTLTEGELDSVTLTSVPPAARVLGSDFEEAKAVLAVLYTCNLGDTSVELNESGLFVVNPRGEGMSGLGPTELLEIGLDLKARLQASVPSHALYILGSPAMHGHSAFNSLLASADIQPTESEAAFIEALLRNEPPYATAWAGELPTEWRRTTYRNDGCYRVMNGTEVQACIDSRIDAKVQEIKDSLSEEALPYFDEESAKAQMSEEAVSGPEEYLSPVFKVTMTATISGEVLTVARI